MDTLVLSYLGDALAAFGYAADWDDSAIDPEWDGDHERAVMRAKQQRNTVRRNLQLALEAAGPEEHD